MPALPRASTRHRFVPLAALLLAAAVACSDAANKEVAAIDADMSGRAPADMSGRAPADMVASPEASLSRGMATMEAPAEMPAPPKQQGGAPATSMLIRRGDVTILVDSIEPAMGALRSLAARLGGTVGNVYITAGEYEVRRATLELRIPSARFDDAMGGLAPVGQVQQSSVTAEDVGEEYTDISARVKNAQRLESRLVDLLATRTGKLEDVLAVERELARVREEIERYEGRLRFLGARVETSTISVTVTEKAPIVGETPGRSVIGEAFVQAWRNFVGLVAWFISSLGLLIPAAVALWLAVRWWRGRKRGSMEA